MTAVIARRRVIEPRDTATARGLECADPWPPTLPEFRQLCQPTPEELGLPTVEDAYRVACLQQPDWPGVPPIVWHARLALGGFELISEPSSRTRPRFEAAYQALLQRALRGERFTFPDALTAPALPAQSQPLTEEERVEAQRWALRLSQIADPDTRQAALASAPVHWQPVIRHYLAWRLGMGRCGPPCEEPNYRSAENRRRLNWIDAGRERPCYPGKWLRLTST